MMQLLTSRKEIFRLKFGREIRGDEPVFFDFDAEAPRPEGIDDADGDEMIATLRAAASKAGVNPDRPLEHFMGRDDLDAYKRRRQS